MIFSSTQAEKLHGHNYQVWCAVRFNLVQLQSTGLTIDFGVLKDIMQKLVDQWDEHLLLPTQNPYLYIQPLNQSSIEVRFSDRYYVFPRNEVILLPVNNTSVENLSVLLAEQLACELKSFRPNAVMIQINETPGQGARYFKKIN